MARGKPARGPRRALSGRLEHHGYTAISSLGRLFRRPVTATMTVLVLAIALALPAGLYLLVKNTRILADSWQQLGEISLFLQQDVELDAARELATEIADRPQVMAATVHSAEDALAEFSEQSSFAPALAALDQNPLPHVILVTPATTLDSAAIEQLGSTLGALEAVEFAQFDMAWLIRFNAIVDTVDRMIRVVAVLLVLGVLLIIGNTIRLDIENRREEIEVTKMLGGTDAFIRRPFLYTGMWYGLLAGLAALVLIGSALLSLAGSVTEVAAAYGSRHALAGPSLAESLLLLGAASLIGLGGSFLAVSRHLAEIEPT